MSSRSSPPATVYCPRCGNANDASARACRVCGAPLPTAEERDRDWSSRTIPLPTQASDWDRQGASRVPDAPAPVEPHRRRRGPGGCVLGCLGLVIIFAVTVGAGAWLLIPIAREATLDGVRDIAATEVMRIGTLPVLPSGELVLSEEDVNRQIRANINQFDRFGPLGTPVFSIDPDGVTLDVDAFGQSTIYRGDVTVTDGRLVVTDPTVDGPAGRLLPADEIADFVEDLAGDLQDRSGVTFTGVELRDGEMIFTTSPTGTPAAGDDATATPRR